MNAREDDRLKRVSILATKKRMFLCILPILVLLAVSILHNGSMTTPGKLYPLIIACIVGIVAFTVYLYRTVVITLEGVRSVGPFSSKDSVTLKKDRTLSITVRPKGKLRIEVYGRDDTPGFDWLKADAGEESADVNLYRDIAIGNHSTVKRVLMLCGALGEAAEGLTKSETGELMLEAVEVKKYTSELGPRYDIKFLETL